MRKNFLAEFITEQLFSYFLTAKIQPFKLFLKIITMQGLF